MASRCTPRSLMTNSIARPVGSPSDTVPLEKWFTREYSHIPVTQLHGRPAAQEALRARLNARARASDARREKRAAYEAALAQALKYTPDGLPASAMVSRQVSVNNSQGAPRMDLDQSLWAEREEDVVMDRDDDVYGSDDYSGDSGNEADCELSTDDDEEEDEYEISEKKVDQFLDFYQQGLLSPTRARLSPQKPSRAYDDYDSGNDADDERTPATHSIKKFKRSSEDSEGPQRKRRRTD